MCFFCGACAKTTPEWRHRLFGNDYRLAARMQARASRGPKASALASRSRLPGTFCAKREFSAVLFQAAPGFRRRLRKYLRGGLQYVLGTLVYDLGRFGVEFTASPRHADRHYRNRPDKPEHAAALLAAWRSVPGPRVLAAVRERAPFPADFSRAIWRFAPAATAASRSLREDGSGNSRDFRPAVMIPGCCRPNPGQSSKAFCWRGRRGKGIASIFCPGSPCLPGAPLSSPREFPAMRPAVFREPRQPGLPSSLVGTMKGVEKNSGLSSSRIFKYANLSQMGLASHCCSMPPPAPTIAPRRLPLLQPGWDWVPLDSQSSAFSMPAQKRIGVFREANKTIRFFSLLTRRV